MIHLLVAFRLASAEPGAAPHRSAAHEPTPIAVEIVEPQWMRYRVAAGEHLVDVAGRFGVEVEELVRWNDLEPSQHRVRAGRRLELLARRDPAPRQRSTYRVQRGDTWQEIAIAHGLDSRKLRAYNWKTDRLRPDDELVIWMDPGQPETIGRSDLDPIALPDIPDGAVSVGRPQMGRIRDPIQLPESPLYVRARPNWAWGSSHTIGQLVTALASLRADAGYGGSIVVGSISRRGGRTFPPHRSHQSGRDVDIRLPVRPGVGHDRGPHPDEIDWTAAWALIDSLLDTEQVQVIFLERPLQRRLYEAARRSGESPQRLADLIEWADEKRWSHAIVRHADGHAGHIHVRFRCSPKEDRCEG